MPIQSCLLPLDGYTSLDVIPFVTTNQVVAFQYILENSPHHDPLRTLSSSCFSHQGFILYRFRTRQRPLVYFKGPLPHHPARHQSSPRPIQRFARYLGPKITRRYWYAFLHDPCYWKLCSEPFDCDEYLGWTRTAFRNHAEDHIGRGSMDLGS